MDSDKLTALVMGLVYAFVTQSSNIDSAESTISVLFLGIIYSAGIYLGMVLWSYIFPTQKDSKPSEKNDITMLPPQKP